MNRIDRFERMERHLREGLAAKGQERIQRFVLGAIIRDCFLTDEPVLEWLAAQLGKAEQPQKEPVATAPTDDHQCPGCNRKFVNHVALNGHGPARCIAKKGTK